MVLFDWDGSNDDMEMKMELNGEEDVDECRCR